MTDCTDSGSGGGRRGDGGRSSGRSRYSGSSYNYSALSHALEIWHDQALTSGRARCGSRSRSGSSTLQKARDAGISWLLHQIRGPQVGFTRPREG